MFRSRLGLVVPGWCGSIAMWVICQLPDFAHETRGFVPHGMACLLYRKVVHHLHTGRLPDWPASGRRSLSEAKRSIWRSTTYSTICPSLFYVSKSNYSIRTSMHARAPFLCDTLLQDNIILPSTLPVPARQSTINNPLGVGRVRIQKTTGNTWATRTLYLRTTCMCTTLMQLDFSSQHQHKTYSYHSI